MRFKRFAIGLRFVITSTTDQMWDLLFESLPYGDLIGAELSMTGPMPGEVLIEPVEILCVSNLSLSRARRLYERMLRNTKLLSSLSLYHPFRQVNYLSFCEETAFLGAVAENGDVRGGTHAFGQMRFLHKELPPIVEIIPIRFLVAGAPVKEGPSAFDVCRKTALAIFDHVPTASAAMVPIDHLGRGMADALVLAYDGRYQRFSLPGDDASAIVGVLPDYCMALDGARLSGAAADSLHMGHVAAAAIQHGCAKLIVAADARFSQDEGSGFVEALRCAALDEAVLERTEFLFLYPDTEASASTADTLSALPCKVAHKSLLQAILTRIALTNRMKDFSHVAIAIEPETAADEAALSDLMDHAKRLLKRAAIVSPAAPEAQLASLAGALWK